MALAAIAASMALPSRFKISTATAD